MRRLVPALALAILLFLGSIIGIVWLERGGGSGRSDLSPDRDGAGSIGAMWDGAISDADDTDVSPGDAQPSPPEELDATADAATLDPTDPAATPDPEELAPFEGIPGDRFVVTFPDWKPPPVPLAASWGVIAHREALVGCRAVEHLARGRPVGSIAYRTVPESEGGPVPHTGATVSIAIFLAAIPLDEQGRPIPGHLAAYAGELQAPIEGIEDGTRLELPRSGDRSDCALRFDDVPPAATAVGEFGHVASRGRLRASGLGRTMGLAFPVEAERFCDDQGWIRLSDVPFELPLPGNGRVDVYDWPRGLFWPELIEVRSEARSTEGLAWTLAEPDRARIELSGNEAVVDPMPSALHRYRTVDGLAMPPIELVGSTRGLPRIEEAVVVTDGLRVAAEAHYAGAGRPWRWTVRRILGSSRTSFSAVLLAPGIQPATAQGSVNSKDSLVFRVRPIQMGEPLRASIVVAPDHRIDLPVTYTLTIPNRGRAVRATGAAIARLGRLEWPADASLRDATLTIAVDAPRCAAALTRAFRERWPALAPGLGVLVETVGTSGDATVVEITVTRAGEERELFEFLDHHDLPARLY